MTSTRNSSVGFNERRSSTSPMTTCSTLGPSSMRNCFGSYYGFRMDSGLAGSLHDFYAYPGLASTSTRLSSWVSHRNEESPIFSANSCFEIASSRGDVPSMKSHAPLYHTGSDDSKSQEEGPAARKPLSLGHLSRKAHAFVNTKQLALLLASGLETTQDVGKDTAPLKRAPAVQDVTMQKGGMVAESSLLSSSCKSAYGLSIESLSSNVGLGPSGCGYNPSMYGSSCSSVQVILDTKADDEMDQYE